MATNVDIPNAILLDSLNVQDSQDVEFHCSSSKVCANFLVGLNFRSFGCDSIVNTNA